MALRKARAPKYPMKRDQVSALVKRLVKPDELSVARDIILFYKAYAETPRWDFWSVYEPGFLLNSIAYFLTDDGRAKIKTDLAIFDLDIAPEPSYTLEITKQGEDRVSSVRSKSLSQLLS